MSCPRTKSGNNLFILVLLYFQQYEDIDVGLKMNSYTVNGLAPGHSYLFELCLRKERYVIPISSMVLTTKNSGFEVEMGIETDYVSLFSVAIILSSMVTVCFTLSLFRMWQYYYYYHSAGPISPGGGGCGGRGGASRKDADSLSQREMIVSPSDHSSVAAAIAASATKKSKNRISRRDGLLDTYCKFLRIRGGCGRILLRNVKKNLVLNDFTLGFSKD